MTQLPDIDVDVSSDQRDEVLQLIIDEFGEDKCCQVVTRQFYTVKTAIKALSKIIDVPFDEVNRITAQIKDDVDYKDNTRVMDFLNKYPFVRDNIDNLLGLLKAHGKHPGALIIFDDPLYNYTSVLQVKGVMVISNNGIECESQGFLKNDTLSVQVLDIQRDCLKLIDDDVVLPNTFDDPNVYKTICTNPLGIFQLEKAAGRQGIKLVQPENFNELVATISGLGQEILVWTNFMLIISLVGKNQYILMID